jgi:ABC-type transporter Mla subunit MlaD
MIRKDELIMTIEDMRKQLQEAQKRADELRENLNKAVQEEEDRKKAQLALEKENRKKEVDEAYENYHTLLKAYIKDYGTYSNITTSSNDSTWFPAWWTRF